MMSLKKLKKLDKWKIKEKVVGQKKKKLSAAGEQYMKVLKNSWDLNIKK